MLECILDRLINWLMTVHPYVYSFYIFREITNGIATYDENGQFIGNSKRAANKGITQVVISRITMAAPGMCEFPACSELIN